MDDFRDTLVERLIEVFQGDTQDEIARKLDTSQGNISKWKNGEQTPTTDRIYDIARVYKVSADWLLGLSDQKDIDGVVPEKLTYEQITRVIDWMLIQGTIEIPDLIQICREYCVDDENDTAPQFKYDSRYDSDYIKVNDRLLSYLLRRRMKIKEAGEDMLKLWKENNIPNFKGLTLPDYTGNIDEAIALENWSMFDDAAWISTIKRISEMSEEERAALIEASMEKKYNGDK